MDNFEKWIEALKKKGMSDEGVGKLLASLTEISGVELYTALMISLTEEDRKTVDGIEDENEAFKKMDELFKLRTGMDADELIAKVQSGMVDTALKKSEK